MSVINQMLRDLEARGEPLPAQGVNGGAANPMRAPLPGITAFSSHRKQQRKTRVLVWSATLCLIVATAIVWHWQNAQIDAARKVRHPLGWAEFKDAINTRPDALLPAALTPTAFNLSTGISHDQSKQNTQTNPTTTEGAIQNLPEQTTPSELTAAPKTNSEPMETTKSTQLPSPQKRIPQAKAKPTTPSPPSTPVRSEATQIASLQPNPRTRPLPVQPETVVLRTPEGSHPVEAQVARAAALIARGRNVEASTLLQQALVTQPDHIAARRALAALQSESGQSAAALVTLLEGTSIDAGLFAPLAATLQFELGDANGALVTLARIPQDKQTAQHHALAAGIAQRAGLHQAAIASFKQALQNNTHEGVWWMGLGVSLEALGAYRDAYQAYKRAADAPTLGIELRDFVNDKLSNIGPSAQLKHAADITQTP